MHKEMDVKEVETLAALARISLTETEKPEVLAKMNTILEYVNQIIQVSADTVSTAVTTTEVRYINVMREDEVTVPGGFYTETLVQAAPRHENNYIKVKKILGGSQ